MDMKDSSEDEDVQNISAFSKFDESIDVRNAEEIKSPINTAMSTSKRSPRSAESDRSTKITARGPTGSINSTQVSRYSNKLTDHVTPGPFVKSSGMMNTASDSEETDDDDIQEGTARVLETYDPKKFEDLQVSATFILPELDLTCAVILHIP